MNILVVDDQPEYRLIMKDILQDEGWFVLTAEDGEDALRVMSRVQVDLVITDIYMPLRDGVKLRQAMRGSKDARLVPIIFVSAFDDEYTVNAVRDPRRETFLLKSSSPQRIIDWVKYLTAPEGNKPLSPNTEKSIRLQRPYNSVVRISIP